jgi:hypothetical protein
MGDIRKLYCGLVAVYHCLILEDVMCRAGLLTEEEEMPKRSLAALILEGGISRDC